MYIGGHVMLMNIHLRKEEGSYTYSDRGTDATPTYCHKSLKLRAYQNKGLFRGSRARPHSGKPVASQALNWTSNFVYVIFPVISPGIRGEKEHKLRKGVGVF
jgi:hypothetical protein